MLLESWVNSLPMLSSLSKETILAECLEGGWVRNPEVPEATPSLTKMEELLHGEMKIFEQDLAELKETLRRCEAQIKTKFPQQQQQEQQKDQTEEEANYHGETRLETSSPDDGASKAAGSLPKRPAKRPHIVTPDHQETYHLLSGATKKQKRIASTKTRKPRKGTVSDEAWARERATSSRDIPVQRPAHVEFHNIRKNRKWMHRAYYGEATYHDTIDSVYDAAIRDQQLHPPVPYTSGISNEMWERDRTMSSLDLPEKRPKGLRYVQRSKKWRFKVQDIDSPLYFSLDAAYVALQESTS